MMELRHSACRVCKYGAVGLLGLTVKFSVLICLHESLGLGYLMATAFAVEAVVLHNFVWHLQWTWGDRSRGISRKEVLIRLLRFHLGNAAVAMVLNLVIMGMLVGHAGIHYLAANLIATAGAGIANFVIADSLVFVTLPQRVATVGTLPTVGFFWPERPPVELQDKSTVATNAFLLESDS